MAKRTNAKGRAQGGQWGVQLHNYMLDCEAWRALKSNGKVLYIEFRRRFWPAGNGRIPYSISEMAQDLGVSRNTAYDACMDLIAKGFIKQRQIGHFDYKVRHATEWELTEYECASMGRAEAQARAGTKEFMQWKPENARPVLTLRERRRRKQEEKKPVSKIKSA